MNFFLMVLSFFIVALGQPAWLGFCAILASAMGFALFWKGICHLRAKRRFWLALSWFTAVQAVQLSWITTMDYMGPLILGVYLFLILSMGVQFGLLSLIIHQNLDLKRILCIAGSWTLFEWIR